MSLLAGLLAAVVLFVPLVLPGLALAGARPLFLVALPWLALAPFARGVRVHLGTCAPLLGLAVGLELSLGERPTALLPFAILLVAWGVLLAWGPARARARVGLFWSASAVLAATPALVLDAPWDLARFHPGVLVWQSAVGVELGLPQAATATALILVGHFLARVAWGADGGTEA